MPGRNNLSEWGLILVQVLARFSLSGQGRHGSGNVRLLLLQYRRSREQEVRLEHKVDRTSQAEPTAYTN